MSTANVAILASGGGTTAEAFIRACAAGQVAAEVTLIICNNPDAGVFARVEQLNQELGLHIATELISSKTHPAAEGEAVAQGCQTAAEEAAVLEALQATKFDLVLLLGYMKRVGPSIIKAFGWQPEYSSPYQAQMLNTHPGLLPETIGHYGIHVQEYVLEKGLAYAGQTLHVVSEKYDEGPTVAEHKVPVEPGDTPESLFARVQATEKQYLPIDVEAFLQARTNYLQQNPNPTSSSA